MLKDESDGLAAVVGQLIAAEGTDVGPVDRDTAIWGGSRPPSTAKRVDFPDPDGPTRET